MRIAYHCSDRGVPVFGTKGCSVHVQEVLRAFDAAGHALELFAARTDGPRPGFLGAHQVHELVRPRSTDTARLEQMTLDANAGARHQLITNGPFDLVYERYSLWSYAAMEYAREHAIPGILEVNAPLIEEQTQYRELVSRSDAREATRRSLAAASHIVAVSTQLASYLRDQFPESASRIHVVGNGVDGGRFVPTSDVGLTRTDGPFTVGFVGSLKPWHGVELLIDAFAALCDHRRDCKLLIVGDGPLRDRLEQRARIALDVDAATVEFTGSVTPDAIPSHLRRMDVAVAPYPNHESFYFSPLKILQYMAASLPVIASRIGDIPRLIRHDVNGVLTAPGDVSQLATQLVRLIEDYELRIRLGTAARQTIISDYSWGHVIQRILRIASESSDPSAALIKAGA